MGVIQIALTMQKKFVITNFCCTLGDILTAYISPSPLIYHPSPLLPSPRGRGVGGEAGEGRGEASIS